VGRAVTGFAVTAAAVRGTADVLAELSEGAATHLAALDAELSDLTSSGWRSPAADGFRGAWQQWHGAALRIRAQLDEMAQLLTVTAAHYDIAEAGTASRFG
jgi:WXG100 family type VII secretion target